MQGLSVLRSQTKQFILENATELVINREVKADDGAGGYTYTDSLLPAQAMRIVQMDPSLSVERRNVSGSVVNPVINVFCTYDADIARGDTFTWDGMKMEVVWVVVTDYFKTAEVAVA